ncbi:Flp pilus assembly protein CpaB [Anaeromyxobacter sp. Fw109-5]|uniref:Flp pilus assembly protein CpaB n=1 Tax=Anaeromyxobacter sp. (strain Fw109-5) TaxID=404589 RepID=UPI000158A819|nr:Flp pilus assembly protein CpaB [Anaeromyxobacter sp. Fw109-5]ABS28147.1 SAF domain protein [Anaeromyxobacter sp. Fw109-5]
MTGSGGGDRGSSNLRRAAEKGSRRTGLRAALFLGIAAIAAIATALLFTRYLEAKASAAKVPTTKVVVASVDIPSATMLRTESLSVIDWPSASTPQGTFADPATLVERVVTSAVSKGEPILESRLAAPGTAAGLAAVLPAGMRAVAVRVNDVVGVAGFLHPGDAVDVIVTMSPSGGGGQAPMSKIILQNVRVLAVGKEVERADRAFDKAIPATVATLMVDSEQSEKLALAATKGQILLSLRSGADEEMLATPGITPPVLLASGREPEQPAPKPSSTPAQKSARRLRARPEVVEAKPAVANKQTVEILRGDVFERRDFEKEARP